MKNNLCLLALAFFLFTCCSSDSDTVNPATALVKKLVINYPGLASKTYNFTYKGNDIFLVKNANNVNVIQYDYTSNRISNIYYLQDHKRIIPEYDGFGKITQYTKYDNNSQTVEMVIVTYFENTFTRTIYRGNSFADTVFVGTELVTIENGNITKVISNFSGTSETETYTYDSKNSPFKNVSRYELFSILDIEITGTTNNITAVVSNTNPYTQSFEYNSANFPVTQTINNGDVTVSTSSYTYN